MLPGNHLNESALWERTVNFSILLYGTKPFDSQQALCLGLEGWGPVPPFSPRSLTGKEKGS